MLRSAERELESAQRAIERMKSASSLDEFEDEWRIYLGAIEKCWVKAERACQHIREKFEPWQGKYKKIRKSDSLLKYLYHARHSDQHSIQEMIEPKSAGWHTTIGRPGQSVYIEHLEIDDFGNVISYKGNRPLEYKFFPQRVELLPVLSSKKWYSPPSKHLEEALHWPAPLKVAELGLSFYQKYLRDIREKFSLGN